jgi:phenylpropionate dioxygenase-like ring-hydroxylating dioxygenase large terminal subunit
MQKDQITPEWRMTVPLDRSAAERGMHQTIPFGWYVVAYSADLAAGAVQPLRYFGRDLVLFRTESGAAQLLDAYCPHLGAHLGHGGAVHGESLACPFHGWQFNGAGQCTAVPYAKNMPPKVANGKSALRAYPVVERNQQIWAWYHPHDKAPTWEVETLPETADATWGPLDRYEWLINAPLQDMGENGADPAHFLYVHGTKNRPDADLTFGTGRMSGIIEAKMQTPRGMVDGRISSYSVGPGQSWVRFEGICETLLVTAITPIESDLIHARFAYTQPLTQLQGPTARLADAIIRDLTFQVDQDKPIWDRKMFWDKPLLCDGDGPIAQFRKYYSQYYAEPAATAG